MFSNDLLKGKTILVTGGGSGLGLAMAKGFAAVGANIAICGRTESKLEAASRELAQFGGETRYYVTDVRDYAGVGAMIQSIVSDFGAMDGLVNNAAGNFLCSSENLSPNGFKTVIDIVLQGSFNCSQQFGKYLIENKRKGSILSITTTYTETGSAFVLPSACAKAGVHALTTSLAYEWGIYGIRCNAIAPGPFPTEGAWSRLAPSKDVQDLMLAHHPMKRVGEQSELANLAVFLMSDLASYINGACIPIDGGERLQGAEFNFFSSSMPREQLNQLFQSIKPIKKS